jgi:hypothetical protein
LNRQDANNSKGETFFSVIRDLPCLAILAIPLAAWR